MNILRTPLVLAMALLATPAVADTCEVWKDREIRCSWERESQLNGKVVLTNKTGTAVAATVNHWVSVCGLAGKHLGETKVSVPASGRSVMPITNTQASVAVVNVGAKTCTEAFVSCGSAKCSDVLVAGAE